MKFFHTLSFSLLAVSSLSAQDEAPEEGWIQLFNGKDLTGWTPKFKGHELGENLRDTFRVEDGLLTVNYDQWDSFRDEFGHLFFESPYSHYRLRVEYRFTGQQVKNEGGLDWAIRNNGLMIHGQSAESMGKNQKFPNSIEVQLLGGLGKNDRGTLNICSPGTHIMLDGKLQKGHLTNTNGPTYHGDQWVTVEVEVRGSEVIRHIAEGKIVVEYSKPQLDDGTVLESGTISLQAESAPTEFRKIELLDLSEEK